MSSVGEEFIAYSETNQGQYNPLIAIAKYDGTLTYRDVTKDDLARLLDNEIVQGCWIFRKTMNATGSWVKRFAVLRGKFIFFFHSPQNNNPIALLPLEQCKVILPENNAKSFDENISFRANDGYEFELQHTTRPTIRLYVLSDLERVEWTNSIRHRVISTLYDCNDNYHVLKLLPPTSNIHITASKLMLAPPAFSLIEAQNMIAALSSDSQTLPPPPPASTVRDSSSFLPPPPSGGGLDSIPHVEDWEMKAMESNSEFNYPPPPPPSEPYDPLLIGLSEEESKQMLETMEIENSVRINLKSKETIDKHRKLEEQNPLTLAELFRLMLFFYNEDLAEDPDPNSAQPFPHPKGVAVEQMLIMIYQRYCNPEIGFMTLAKFVEFMEDSAILHTHAPHDDNDEPLDEYKEALDPINLMKHVPTNLETLDQTSSYYVSYQQNTPTITSTILAKEKHILNFGQFYHLLLTITEIVYSELYQTNPTLAFNKFITEVICPFYLWSKGRYKRGSTDPLVLEERILLVLNTYAPNLWRVFLTYATDVVGKISEVTLSYPDAAQLNERGLFKLPPVAPPRFYQDGAGHKTNLPESLVVNENGLLRFARDYGLTPNVVTQAQVREIYRKINRNKTIISSRLPSREQVFNQAHSLAQKDKIQRQKEMVKPMSFNNKKPITKLGSKQPTKASEDNTTTSKSTVIPPSQFQIGGLGFSEFIECIAQISLEGLEQPNYDMIFPTPFSKILSILTVWGVADLTKLEEVRIIRTDEVV